MELIIIDEFTKKRKRIKDPKFIPRLNEHINCDYEPYPKVIRIEYHFDENVVVVFTK